jgi:hypothetical protein
VKCTQCRVRLATYNRHLFAHTLALETFDALDALDACAVADDMHVDDQWHSWRHLHQLVSTCINSINLHQQHQPASMASTSINDINGINGINKHQHAPTCSDLHQLASMASIASVTSAAAMATENLNSIIYIHLDHFMELARSLQWPVLPKSWPRSCICQASRRKPPCR